jgi:hypothetical protein
MAPFRAYLSNLRLNKQIYPSYYFEEYRVSWVMVNTLEDDLPRIGGIVLKHLRREDRQRRIPIICHFPR